jgi:DNA anti-recombination protein RmuC
MNQRFDDMNRSVNQRFDDMKRNVNQRFDDMKRNVNQRFDDMERNVSQRFDAQDGRLDRLTEEVSELRQLTVGIVERVSRNEDRIQAIQEQLQSADAP